MMVHANKRAQEIQEIQEIPHGIARMRFRVALAAPKLILNKMKPQSMKCLYGEIA